MTVRRTFDEFLDIQKARLSEKTFSRYRSAIGLLESYLDGHGEPSPPGEARFCDSFGPEHVLPKLAMFLNWFLPRKVQPGPDAMKAMETTLTALRRFLAEKGVAVAEEEVPAAADRRRRLDATRLERGLARWVVGSETGARGREGRFRISRVQGARIWLQDEVDLQSLGPITLPVDLAALCQVGMCVAGVVGREGRRWRLLEAWGVYPGN